MIAVNCKECGKEFKTYPSKVTLGRGKYCSRDCSDLNTLIKKGQQLSRSTEIKHGERLPDHIHKKQFGKKAWNDKGLKGYKTTGTGYRSKKKTHRLVIEKIIGRELHTWEIVHHVNEHKADNRSENLWLFANTKSHVRHHRGLDSPKSDVLFKGGVHKSP